MIIALKITQEDQEQAARLLAWIDKLGGIGPRKLLLCIESKVVGDGKPPPTSADTLVIRYTDAFHHFPESNNLAFQEIANYCKEILKAPFLYMEANAVPLRAGWLDDIEAAYRQAVNLRKPFMGDVIKLTGHPDSFAPVGVYPPNITDFAGEMMTAHDEEPWTVAAAGQMGQWTVKTPLIRHAWDGATLDALGPECVLAHPDRTGSFLETLSGVRKHDAERGRLGVKTLEIADTSSTTAHEEVPPPAQSISGPESHSNAAAGHGSGAGDQLASDGNYYPPNTVLPHGVKPCLYEPRAALPNLVPLVPWENKDESIEEIRRLCARLKEFETCPAYTALVRKELKSHKVTR